MPRRNHLPTKPKHYQQIFLETADGRESTYIDTWLGCDTSLWKERADRFIREHPYYTRWIAIDCLSCPAKMFNPPEEG